MFSRWVSSRIFENRSLFCWVLSIVEIILQYRAEESENGFCCFVGEGTTAPFCGLYSMAFGEVCFEYFKHSGCHFGAVEEEI